MDNIKINLKEIGQEGVRWICLAEDNNKWKALVNVMMNLQVQ